MKRVIVLLLTLIMWAGAADAQQKTKQKSITTTVFATDITCEHCAKKIMDNVPALGKGIKDVKVDVKSKQVSVTYDQSKNNDEKIINGFASIKVKATVKQKGK